MEIRFYNDPETGLPHIYEHGVTESEVYDVFLGRGEDLPARRGSRMKLGQTSKGATRRPRQLRRDWLAEIRIVGGISRV